MHTSTIDHCLQVKATSVYSKYSMYYLLTANEEKILLILEVIYDRLALKLALTIDYVSCCYNPATVKILYKI